MPVIKHTTSTCPKCKTLLPSTVIEDKTKVYLNRFCKTHGEIKTVVWGNAEQYIRFNKMENKDFNDKKNLLFLEITRKCPLNCQTCFNKSNMDSPVKDMTLSEISNILQTYVNISEREPVGVMLCGGEPTLRDDLPDIIKMARNEGIQQIFLNTNGIRIVQDIDFFKKICEAGLNTIYLQFNDINTDKQLPSGETIKNFQNKIITNLRSVKINGTFLVPTVVKGINDNIVYDIVKFGLNRRDIITGISFHCAMHTGEWYDKYNQNRITPYEIMKKIDIDSNGDISINDFFPFNYTYPLFKILTSLTGLNLPRFFYSFECGVCTILLIKPDGSFLPISRILNIELLEKKFREIYNHIAHDNINKLYSKAYITKEIVKLLFDKKVVKGEKGKMMFSTFLSALNINKNRTRTRFFIILISQFLDSYNFDMDCNKRCTDDICVIKDGKAYKFPFCYYNVFKRDEFEKT